MPGTKRNLINMGDAFMMYHGLGQSRSLPKLYDKLQKLNPDQCPAYTTLKKWHKQDEWKLQVMMLDKEIRDGVKEKMMPEWIEVKVYLIKTLIEQVKMGRDVGVAPDKTSDLIAASKEIRALMGEGDSTDVSISGIQYVPHTPKEEEDEDQES